ncbi:CASP-like protein 5B2 [Punica granatum]|uniref:CASP-like protein 5B2 n=2 Tax=Punica granatum TaxID=22663 RepID=A0A6P8E3V8_PUNGR|nr:CASP-like protein 5B2 [Punica granatum]PKI65500.1 hypothetical protein CRG98_014110 [Punica granatum]
MTASGTLKMICSLGRVGSLVLRVAQMTSSAVSMAVLFIDGDVDLHAAFSYEIAAMSFLLVWSSALVCLDVYSLKEHRNVQTPKLLRSIVIGDWLSFFLSLSAACSSAGVLILYTHDLHYWQTHTTPILYCEISTAVAFTVTGFVFVSASVTFITLASSD